VQAQRPHPHKTPHVAVPHISRVVIGTVPPVVGYPVTVGGVTHLTDNTGVVGFVTPVTSEDLSDRLTVGDRTVSIAGRPVQVTPTRLYSFESGAAQIALDLSYPVRFHFSGPAGLTGEPINTITLKSETGQVSDLPAGQSSWLEGTRAGLVGTRLAAKNVEWSIQKVVYGGSNVVNESQQRFSPASTADVAVPLLFYSFDLHVRDALFGFSRSGVVELDAAGRLHLASLPRGNYVLTPMGPGPRMAQTLTISRNQSIEFSYYSWLDIMTVLGVVVLLAGALALAGWLRRRRPQRVSPSDGFRRPPPRRRGPVVAPPGLTVASEQPSP
jgi:hypothetical protein